MFSRKMYRKFFFSMLILCYFASLLTAQQQYSNESISNCNSTDKTGPSPTYLYACNSPKRSCQAYLIYRTQDSYDSATDVSNLTSSVLPELCRINNISSSERLRLGSEVIVPVNCSCSGKSYQATTSYTIQNEFETYFTIAKDTFEGLSSCNALIQENPYDAFSLEAGLNLRIPLRCACPTQNQTSEGIKFLLTHSVAGNDNIVNLSHRFNVTARSVVEANGFSDEDPSLHPLTTILIPLRNKPLTSTLPSHQTPPNSSAPSPKTSNSNKTWIYAVMGTLSGISLVSVSALIVLGFCFYKIKRKRDSVIVPVGFENAERPVSEKKDKLLPSSESSRDVLSSIAQSFTIYTYEELQLATDNFSSSSLLGGSGSVYQGKIREDFAAIKKVSGDVSQEINILNKISHLNLIRLWGVCFHDGYWYLVYEYAEKGALSGWIYGKLGEDKNVLCWMQRIQIAFDVASGLSYLHSYTSPPLVHRDLKCSNVVLDAEFRAKITNFGLARSMEAEGGGEVALTRHIIGTKGYMAPEYLENGFISSKLDVYSFGILLLEILTGQEVATNLHLWESLVPILDEKNGNQIVRDFMDPSLEENYPSDLAVLLIKVVDSCLKKDPSSRPGMHEIVQTLSATINATIAWESTL